MDGPLVSFVFILIFNVCDSQSNNKLSVRASSDLRSDTSAESPLPYSPLIPCDHVWDDFLDCDDPLDLRGNESARQELGYGCVKFGGPRIEDVYTTDVNCTVLGEIECYGPRTFIRKDVPCIKFTGHYFVTTLLYSILLGFLGMDRFVLGHTGTAVGKLLTLGGVGIWWLVDIVLLVTGHLMPKDGSSWMPYA